MATESKDDDLGFETSPEGHGSGDAVIQQDSSSDIPLQVPTVSEQVPQEPVDGKRRRVPRRVLHFSDGIMEEYSTEDEDETDRPADTLNQLRAVDTKSLGWGPWAWYWFRFAGYRTLSSVDSAGEKLAWMLGITSPKYQYELDEYYEMKRKEEEEKEQRDMESAGWTPGTAMLNQATNPAAYLVDPDQSAAVTLPPGQSAAVTSPPGQSAAGALLAEDERPAAAGDVSGLPVAAGTIP